MRVSNFWAILALLSLAAVSCRQDNIFQIIASETAPRDPRIAGTPCNMVVFNRTVGTETVPIMCVASKRLHWYAKAPDADAADFPRWDSDGYLPQPGGMISALAVTKNGTKERLYALCRDGLSVNARLRYIESDGADWTPVGSAGPIQTIFADPEGELLFAGTRTRDPTSDGKDYTISYYKADGTGGGIMSNTSLLSGVVKVSNDYYLSTAGDGIYKVSTAPTTATQLTGGALHFTSIINLGSNNIIAVERNGGRLYKLDTSEDSFSSIGSSTGGYATNASASWEEPASAARKLFLVGIQGGLFTSFNSSYTYGYVEFDINTGGSISGGRAPSISVMSDTSRYMATLGKYPVNHLYQAPPNIDPEMTSFAATQLKGLWSYRDRPGNGGWQWNAEE